MNITVETLHQFLHLGFALIGALLWGAGSYIVKKEIINKGKIWLVRLNSNNKTGQVTRVRATREGYQIKDGPFVKFEGDYAYIDRLEQRPIFVCNEDTGSPIKAKTGESQEMDGSIYAAFAANRDIERLNLAGQGINWAMLACIVGGVAILGLIIIGTMVSKLAPSGG